MRHRNSFALLVALASLAFAIGNRASGSLLQYHFHRSDCLSGYIPAATGDEYFGSLQVNQSTTSCFTNRVGVIDDITSNWYQSPIMSTRNASRLAQQLNGSSGSFTGFTIELWAQLDNRSIACPDENEGCVSILVSVSAPDHDTGEIDRCSEKSNFELRYFPLRDLFQLSLRRSAGVCGTWGSTAGFTSNAGSGIFHLVVTIPIDGILPIAGFFVNGELDTYVQARTPAPDEILSEWHEDYTLQVFDRTRPPSSSVDSYTPFPGSVFYLAMYGRELSASEALQNYAAGMPNSTTLAENTTAYISEDGEIGDHYDNPAFYNSEVPSSSLSIVSLSVYDADEDPDLPNYSIAKPDPRLFVDTLPSTGTLYSMAGEEIVELPHEVFRTDGNFSLRYRPLWNTYSGNETVYANFTFHTVDTSNNERSAHNATVDIHVLPKNDPPRPHNMTNQHIIGGGTANILRFEGGDIDDGDAVEGALITETPARGLMYQVFENGSVSDTIIGNNTLLWTLYAAYKYDANYLETNNHSVDYLDNDNFSFRVLDASQALSVQGFASVKIFREIRAFSPQSMGDSSWQCYEGSDNLVYMFGDSGADSRPDIMFDIQALPHQGYLFDPTTQANLTIGSRLNNTDPYPFTEGVAAGFRTPAGYFNSPRWAWNGSEIPSYEGLDNFSFSVAAQLGETRNNVVVSDIISQVLQVINVNDISTLTCPTDVYEVQAIGNDGENNDTSQGDRVYINGFTLDDPDNAVDIVKVRVVAQYGVMTLNPQHITSLDFFSATYCFGHSSWWCKGAGTDDGEMIFLALPQDIENALNGMMYQSYSTDIVDTITTTIYDGAGGDCLANAKFKTNSKRPTCGQSSCSFNVSVSGRYYSWDDDDTTDGGGSVVLHPLVLLSIVLGVLFVAFTLCTFLANKMLAMCCRILRRLCCWYCKPENDVPDRSLSTHEHQISTTVSADGPKKVAQFALWRPSRKNVTKTRVHVFKSGMVAALEDGHEAISQSPIRDRKM